MDELTDVELLSAADQWKPRGFNLELEPQSRWIAHLQLPQILVSLILNGIVIICAVRNHSNLLSSAANVLMVSVFVNYFAFAVLMAETRIVLLLTDNHWSKNQCLTFASVCVFFVAHGAFNLMAICFERYLALVRLIRVKRQHAIYGLLASMATSLGLTVLHFVPQGGAVISSSGLYCFPTRLVGWQGALDAAAMIVHFVAILWGYLLIYLQLRKLARRATSTMNFPGLGNSTMANLGHKLGLSSIIPSSIKRPTTLKSSAVGAGSSTSSTTSKPGGVRSAQELSAHHRSLHEPVHHLHSQTSSLPPAASAPPASVTTAAATTGGPRGSTHSLETAVSKMMLKASSSSLARQARSILSPNHPEGRVVLRGLLSLAAYSCFVVSYSHLAWVSLLYHQRPSVTWDWFLVSTRLFPDIGDPLILFYLDRQFREALFRLLGKA